MSYGSAALARRLRLRSVRSVVYACAGLGLLLAVVTISGTWGLPILRTVDVSVDGKDMTVHTFKRTVGGVLAAGGISLQADDRVTPAADTLVWPDMRVTVVRAVPFSVVVAGRSYPRRVAAETVGEALRTLGIRVGPIDKVYPGLQAALRPGARVTIERREWRTWVEYGAIPFGSAVVNDVSLFKGNTVVRSTGRVGTKERSVRVLYANGKPAMMEPRAWAVAQAPTPRVIAVGTRAMIASRGEFAGREYMMLEATAYYPGPNNFGGGVGPRTAIGMVAQRGIVAVDPSLIPLGSHLYIEGYGYAVAGDTGGSIRGRRIDLCYNSYGEAIQFGRREVKVYIIGGR
ncbi:MAG TPA: ubiquitin-like domain-containing protein [bacterium]|nr:ubiquitin-like domain-containing protein [bacterium]